MRRIISEAPGRPAADMSNGRPSVFGLSSFRRMAARAWQSNGFLALIDQGLVSLTTFGTGVVVGRICGKGAMGAYALAWTLISIALDLATASIVTPYSVFLPDTRRDRRRSYLGSVIAHQLFLSVLLGAGIWLMSAFRLWPGAPPDAGVMFTLAGVIAFITFREFARRVEFAQLRVRAALAIDVVACLCQAAGLLLLVRYGSLTVSRLYLLLGACGGGVSVIWLLTRRTAFRIGLNDCRRDFTRNWKSAKWFLSSGLLWTLATYLYPWMLTAIKGTAAVGTWATCSAVAALGNPVLLGLANYIQPKISHIHAQAGAMAMRRYVYRSSLVLAALILPLVAVIAVWGERIMIAIYGNSFSHSGIIALLLTVNLLLNALGAPYSRGLFALDRGTIDTLVNLGCVLLMFALGIASVRAYSVLGAAIAMLVSGFITAVIRVSVFAREVRRSRWCAPDGYVVQAAA